MPKHQTIDIRKVAWPICVLNCKKDINQMEKGEQMDILVKDSGVAENIIALMKNLLDYTMEKNWEDKHYRLIIKKR